jgi:hypothetical protein
MEENSASLSCYHASDYYILSLSGHMLLGSLGSMGLAMPPILLAGVPEASVPLR